VSEVVGDAGEEGGGCDGAGHHDYVEVGGDFEGAGKGELGC